MSWAPEPTAIVSIQVEIHSPKPLSESETEQIREQIATELNGMAMDADVAGETIQVELGVAL